MNCPICGEPIVRGECSSCGFRVDEEAKYLDEDSTQSANRATGTYNESTESTGYNERDILETDSTDTFGYAETKFAKSDEQPKTEYTEPTSANTEYLGWRKIGIAIDNVVSQFIFNFFDSNKHYQASERNKLRRYGDTTMADRFVSIKLTITALAVFFLSTLPLIGVAVDFCGWRYAAYLSAYSRGKNLRQHEYWARLISIICGVVFAVRLLFILN